MVRRVIVVKEEVVGIGDLVETKGSGAFDVVGGGGVLVRVELEGQPPERLLNLLLGGASPHAQHLVRIHHRLLNSNAGPLPLPSLPLQQNTQSKSNPIIITLINIVQEMINCYLFVLIGDRTKEGNVEERSSIIGYVVWNFHRRRCWPHKRKTNRDNGLFPKPSRLIDSFIR